MSASPTTVNSPPSPGCAAGQEETPARGTRTCVGVQPLSVGVRKDKQLHSQLLTWPTKSPSEKKLTAACGAKAARADVPLFQSRADDLPR